MRHTNNTATPYPTFLKFNRITPFLATLLLLASGIAMPAASHGAPLKIVVAVPPGGPMDVIARQLAARVTDQTGEVVLVHNRPGAMGLIGTRHVVDSAGDGSTLLLGGSFLVTNALTIKFAPNPIKDLKPVIQLQETEQYLAIRSGLRVSAPGDLERLARECPEGLNCGAVPGQLGMACQHLKALLGGRVVSIPYSGMAPALNALVAGQIDLLFTNRTTLIPMTDMGKIQVLAALGSHSGKPPFDSLPLMKDIWPSFVMSGWSGIFAPASTPDTVVNRLNRRFNEALADPQLRGVLEAQGYKVVGGQPEALADQLSKDMALCHGILKDIGMRPH